MINLPLVQSMAYPVANNTCCPACLCCACLKTVVGNSTERRL